MENILLINGYEPTEIMHAELNEVIFYYIKNYLQRKNIIMDTIVSEGYVIEDEQEKFRQADTIVFQSPIYWFSVPSKLKKYVEDVYSCGLFYDKLKTYGEGGLFKNKKYMFSLTLNAPKKTFEDKKAFFSGKNVDEVLYHWHKVQQFCGMQPLKTFAVYNVFDNSQAERHLLELETHLEKVFAD